MVSAGDPRHHKRKKAHFVFHALMQLILDECSVQILLDALVQIGVHGLCFFFCSYGNHGNLICHNLGSRQRLCKRLGLRLVVLAGDLSPQGHDARSRVLHPDCTHIRRLPVELQRHLHFAWSIALVKNLAEGGAAKRRVGAAKLRMVEGVKGFETVFKAHPFTNRA